MPDVSRRQFLNTAAAAVAVAGSAGATPLSSPHNSVTRRFRPKSRFGLGGVPFGNAFVPTLQQDVQATIDAAWDQGVRYFDTSPWYGLGLSERRLGVALQGRPRGEYTLSTKIGRLLTPDASKSGQLAIWQDIPPFAYHYDYTADGARRSVEASLQRLGVAQLDIVFIHDLSPDNGDMKWTEQFEIARKGAMKELTRMREEGLIKAWGMGVNELPPARRALEEADPDIILQATKYSLMDHTEALDTLFPLARKSGASIVVGTPLMVGFLAGRQRYLWSGTIPAGAIEKRASMSRLAQDHGIDLLSAALQFCNAPDVVSAVIPGARTAQQLRQNAAAMRARIPSEFWQALKREGLIAGHAPVPD